MKIQATVKKEFDVSTLIVEAEVRYWEDGEVNGKEDVDGTLIPFREGNLWKPVIELETGIIRGWPQGTAARVHYKVCDAGEYWLGDEKGKKLFKYREDYVPTLLAVGESGYGDYIILNIVGFGKIEGWRVPILDGDDWKPL